ncbi:MAG: sporulation transcription factor Spo0A [Clostridia bacterium]|nr:sporulation transcription factor Spo0A [Clostridia bacterium]
MEKTISLLIANEKEGEYDSLIEKLTDEIRLDTIDKTSSGIIALEFAKTKSYDIAIVDLVLPGIDGFEVIEQLKKKNKGIKVVATSSLSNEIFINKAMNLGVDYYMLKPISTEVFVKRVIDLANISSKPVTESKIGQDKGIEEKITNIFITVGIPAHIKGYQFLREAIKLAMENPDIINSITKKLYPSIAERFDTSASKVERAIRHAIEVAWNRGKIENINSIFGLTVYSNNEKPTNGEFIALVADKMLLEV